MIRQVPFHDRLVAAMNDRELSIDRLAHASGIGARSIARYRKGQIVPVDAYGRPSPNAYALAAALDMDVTELMGEPEAMAS